MSRQPASLIDPTAEVFVVPDRDRPKLRTVLNNLPRIQVIRTGPSSDTRTPYAHRNSEAHALPGGGILFTHGPVPYHETEARNADYMRTGPDRVAPGSVHSNSRQR